MSTICTEAIAQGAPGAVQVADRWHILKNLTEAVEEVLKHHRGVLRHVAGNGDTNASITEGQVSSLAPQAIRPLPSRRIEQRQDEERKARSERYEQVLALVVVNIGMVTWVT